MTDDKKNLPINALDVMTTNVNVGIDEVVSVFVSRWEEELHKKKDALQKRIKELKASIEAMKGRLKSSVNAEDYVQTIPMLGIQSKITETKVYFEAEQYDKSVKPMTIVVNVGIYSLESDRNYAAITKKVVFDMTEEDIEAYTSAKSELDQKSIELVETMTEIKSVSRKERMVRGRISEMKLSQSGMSDLLKSPDLLQLIEVK